MRKKITHGGVRKGAGRPKGRNQYGETTKPIRLPLSLIPAIKQYIDSGGYQLPYYGAKVPAGSPAHAEDYIEDYLDLNTHLIKHPHATFVVKASGHSMLNAGIHENDYLIVDQTLAPSPGKIIVLSINGQLTVKRLHKQKNGKLILRPDNPDYSPIEVEETSDVHIWGVVTTVIHSV